MNTTFISAVTLEHIIFVSCNRSRIMLHRCTALASLDEEQLWLVLEGGVRQYALNHFLFKVVQVIVRLDSVFGFSVAHDNHEQAGVLAEVFFCNCFEMLDYFGKFSVVDVILLFLILSLIRNTV